jgi:hypothetical protein
VCPAIPSTTLDGGRSPSRQAYAKGNSSKFNNGRDLLALLQSSRGDKMKVGDLVRDKTVDQMGIIVDLHWEDTESEMYAVVQLFDNTKVLCSYGDMELIACSDL